MLTRERLKEVLSYDPCSGLFRWKAKSSEASRITIGQVAGCVDPAGYRRICIDLHYHRSCRLAWFYCYGEWPNTIDHINRNSEDDSLWNLSNGTQKDNMRNSRIFGPRNLTMNQVREIQKRRGAGERGVDLAKEYRVSEVMICEIHRRKPAYTKGVQPWTSTESS